MHWRRSLAVGIPLLIAAGLLLAFATTASGIGVGPGVGFRSNLIGFHETPVISTVAHGDFEIHFTGPTSMAFTLHYFDLTQPATVAHIHLGQIGVAGGVSVFLCGGSTKPACPAGTSATVTGTIVPADVIGPTGQGITAGEFDELVRAMKNGFTYANVHNATFPNGEIRGQLIN